MMSIKPSLKGAGLLSMHDLLMDQPLKGYRHP